MSKILHVHNYPINSKQDIFDIQIESENFFVSTNKGVSYLGKLEDFNESIIFGNSDFLREVPMGYTNLCVEERLRIYFKGKCIWKNENVVDFNQYSEDDLEKLHIDEYAKTATSVSIMNFSVRCAQKNANDAWESSTINEKYVYNTEKFHDAVKEASTKSEDGYTIITRVLMNRNWH